MLEIRELKKIQQGIRDEYSPEDEWKILRETMARILVELEAVLPQSELTRIAQSKEIQAFWKYHDFVEQICNENPDRVEENCLEESIQSLHEEIAGSFGENPDSGS